MHFVGLSVVSTLQALINVNISLATITLNTSRQDIKEKRQKWKEYKNVCVCVFVCVEDKCSCIVIGPHGILKESVIN